jgi:hypothetical protein
VGVERIFDASTTSLNNAIIEATPLTSSNA